MGAEVALMSFQQSPNFSFLVELDPRVVRDATLAERALSFGDPVGSLSHLRRYGERLAHVATVQFGTHLDGRVDQVDRLRALQRHQVERQVLDMFHSLRVLGNEASHEGDGTQSKAFHHLKIARELGVWLYRFARNSQGFKPAPFVPPPNMEAETEKLKKEIEGLIEEAEAREAERDEAQEAVEAEREARLGVEAAAKEAEEKAKVYEELATEAESKGNADFEVMSAMVSELEAKLEAALAAQAKAVEEAPPEVIELKVEASKKASTRIHLDEAATRALIDQQLRDAGWEASTTELRYAAGVRPQKGKNLAISEWPTESGPADYVLFVGLMPVAVVEAKRHSKDVSEALEQARRYSEGFAVPEDCDAPGGPWDGYNLPFLFSTNGREFLEQVRTKSGIWHLDARRKRNRAKPLHAWPTPQGLKEKLKQDIDRANQKLDDEPTDYLDLRDYQVAAIKAVEAAITKEVPAVLPRHGDRDRQDENRHWSRVQAAQGWSLPPHPVPRRSLRAWGPGGGSLRRNHHRGPPDLQSDLQCRGPQSHSPSDGYQAPHLDGPGHGPQDLRGRPVVLPQRR